MTPTVEAQPGQKCDSCGLPAVVVVNVAAFCIGCLDYYTELERAHMTDTERDRAREERARMGSAKVPT